MRDFVEKVFSKLDMQIFWKGQGANEVGCDQYGNVRIKIDPIYFRPTEVPFLLGDSTKARELLGWKPTYTLEDLIHDMISNERNLLT